MILKDLLRRSFRMINVLHEGQGMNGDDVTDSIYVLNDMLGAWNIDPLAIFTPRIDLLTLTQSQQSYTIGIATPPADFAVPRPENIERANLVLNTLAPPLRRPIEIINLEQWAAIKLQGVHSSMPLRLYYQPTFPLGKIFLWPYPDQAFQLELFGWLALSQFATVDDLVTLPNGYSEAIAANLAVRLAAEWDKPLRPDVAALAASSKAAIESHNAPSPLMEVDSMGLTGPGSSFNRLTGDLE